ncbi:MAG: hypothetical protein KJ072_00765 [Verrucomicrobia bacterium]|nr:hypothetical protein [Verrucomicrobiota bacterium]
MLGPFQVLKPSITLRPKQPPRSGSEVAPVAWWKFDEQGGTNAANAAGTGLVGRIHGEASWAPAEGRHQGALELDGRHNWIECAESTDLDFRDGLSISVWIKPRELPNGGDTLVAKGEAWGLQRLKGTGELEFTLSGPQAANPARGNELRVVSKRPLTDLQWHHVAAVYDGKRIALYVDGVEEDSVKASGPIALNNLPLTLGGNAANRASRWHGSLDEVRLFDRGLSAGEIKTLHSGGL